MRNAAVEEKLATFAHYLGRTLREAPLAQEYLRDLVETAYNEGYRIGNFCGFTEGMEAAERYMEEDYFPFG